jgi:hypothetical protein
MNDKVYIKLFNEGAQKLEQLGLVHQGIVKKELKYAIVFAKGKDGTPLRVAIVNRGAEYRIYINKSDGDIIVPHTLLKEKSDLYFYGCDSKFQYAFYFEKFKETIMKVGKLKTENRKDRRVDVPFYIIKLNEIPPDVFVYNKKLKGMKKLHEVFS